MKTFFLTFGQEHRHVLKSMYFDKDCIVQIEAKDYDEARKVAFMVFGKGWAWLYESFPGLGFFPRGILKPVFKSGIPYNVHHLVEVDE